MRESAYTQENWFSEAMKKEVLTFSWERKTEIRHKASE